MDAHGYGTHSMNSPPDRGQHASHETCARGLPAGFTLRFLPRRSRACWWRPSLSLAWGRAMRPRLRKTSSRSIVLVAVLAMSMVMVGTGVEASELDPEGKRSGRAATRPLKKSRDLQATAVEIPWSGTVTVDMTEELSDPSGSCLRTYSATLTFSGSDSAQISGTEAYTVRVHRRTHLHRDNTPRLHRGSGRRDRGWRRDFEGDTTISVDEFVEEGQLFLVVTAPNSAFTYDVTFSETWDCGSNAGSFIRTARKSGRTDSGRSLRMPRKWKTLRRALSQTRSS